MSCTRWAAERPARGSVRCMPRSKCVCRCWRRTCSPAARGWFMFPGDPHRRVPPGQSQHVGVDGPVHAGHLGRQPRRGTGDPCPAPARLGCRSVLRQRGGGGGRGRTLPGDVLTLLRRTVPLPRGLLAVPAGAATRVSRGVRVAAPEAGRPPSSTTSRTPRSSRRWHRCHRRSRRISQ